MCIFVIKRMNYKFTCQLEVIKRTNYRYNRQKNLQNDKIQNWKITVVARINFPRNKKDDTSKQKIHCQGPKGERFYYIHMLQKLPGMHTLTALCCYVKCQQTEHSYMYNTRIQQLLAELLYLFFDPGSVDRRSPQKINQSTPAVWNQYCFLWVEMYYLTNFSV